MLERSVQIPQRVLDRIWGRIDMRGPDECWPWKLSTASHGYGQVGWWESGHSVMTTAHRAAWTAEFGPIPDDLTVDHLCHNRPCCNPRHLRPLTLRANCRDNGYATRTHCPRGHPYDAENTYLAPAGGRRCRECHRIRQRSLYELMKKQALGGTDGNRVCAACKEPIAEDRRIDVKYCNRKCANAARFLKKEAC